MRVRNRLVNDGRTDAGDLNGPAYGVGIALWDPDETGERTGVDAHHNVVGWRRGTDLTRNDTWLPACQPVDACLEEPLAGRPDHRPLPSRRNAAPGCATSPPRVTPSARAEKCPADTR